MAKKQTYNQLIKKLNIMKKKKLLIDWRKHFIWRIRSYVIITIKINKCIYGQKIDELYLSIRFTSLLSNLKFCGNLILGGDLEFLPTLEFFSYREFRLVWKRIEWICYELPIIESLFIKFIFKILLNIG